MAPWIIGLGLSQIGEFSFVLARSGLSGGSLSKNTYDLALTCTIVTMALSPLVSSAALPLGRAWRRWRKPAQPLQTISLPDEDFDAHVVVAGYGRTGRAVGQIVRAAGIPLVVVESDHALLGDMRNEGFSGVWGDITREEVLQAARIKNARILVLTVPNRSTVELSVERARRANPLLVVIARAVREQHVAGLRKLGVDAAVQPEFEGGIEMVRQVLVRCNYNDAEILRLIAKLRDDLYREPAD